MQVIPDKKKLIAQMDSIRRGNLVVPQFQRTFVWDYNDVVDFLVSLFKGYFVGTFLFERCDSDSIPFDFRPIEGTNLRKEDCRPEFMILDGQQRITTLHYVLFAPKEISLKNTKYPYRFFIDLKKLLDDNIEDAIFGEREKDSSKYYDKTYQHKNMIVPFTVLIDYKSWDGWLDKYEDYLRQEENSEEFDSYREKTRPVLKERMSKFFDTEIPVIEIPKVNNDDEQGISEVCAIFEKMNSTGVKLSVFDLLTARLYKYGIDLHSLWEETVDNYDLVEDFSNRDSYPYGIFILRIIALMRNLEVKAKILINLSPVNFEDDWRIASEYTQKALKRLQATNNDGFGVFENKWLPYPPVIPVLAAFLAYLDSNNEYQNTGYKLLKKWYWGTVFGERYQSAVETKTAYDYKYLVRALETNDLDNPLFKEINDSVLDNPNFSLISVYRISSIYKGVMNLLAINGARDFRLLDSIEFHELDDHHIFPKIFLSKQRDVEGNRRYNEQQINTIVNRTLISGSTNRKISGKSPSSYIRDDEIIKDSGVLYNHFISQEAIKSMELDNYEKFLEERNKLIVADIKQLLRL